MHLHLETPTFTLQGLQPGALHLKMEAFQPPGSFKLRGVGLLAQRAVQRGASHLVASSGGNAGLAAAWAARRLGVAATVYVPNTTPPRIQELLRLEGAQVVVAGEVWDQANEAALTQAQQPGVAFVHPFDHPDLWEGHASLVHELAQQIPRPARLFLSVGGGGLLCGVLQGLRDVGWGDLPVIAVETRGAASFELALRLGRVQPLQAITSIARSLGALAVAPEALRSAQHARVTPWLLDDRDATDACCWAADRLRVLVEPACGAALAAALNPKGPAAQGGDSAVIVCGGAACSLDELAQWSSLRSTP